ncbi:caspase domain-containing protein [Mycena capillaripes]|nr:caspase domain-containing protein [Mycena capillaripes]
MALQIFALVIGIDQYRSKGISDLQGCGSDAGSMHEVLSQYSKDAQIWVVKDAEATREGILRAFENHLLHNPSIKRNDAIVVYFAGKGRRLSASQGASGRDVDLLVPYDYGENVPGISDSAIHSLLSELAQNKGTNITLILDTSFSFYVPRGNAGHRSDTSVIPPSHVSAAAELGYSTQYTGFFSDTRPSYVLLAACQQQQLAYESPDGGAFTRELVKFMRHKRTATYREMANALRFEGQDSFCAGLYADRVLFSAPQYSEIPKLRVFLDSEFSDLDFETENHFVRVQDKGAANLVLRRSLEGGTTIERLDRLVALYASPDVIVPARNAYSLTCVLNKIAHFNYYLGLEPPKTPSSNPLHYFDRISPALELYSFKYSPGGSMTHRNRSGNLLKNGVVKLDSFPPDRAYAIKIISHSRQSVYPYLVLFDPATYNIQVVHPPPGESAVEPLRGRGLFQFLSSASSLVVGDGWSGGTPLTFGVAPAQQNRDAAFFKLILCEKPIDISQIPQDSAIQPSNTRAGTCRTGLHTPIQIPGIWDTALATVALQRAIPPTNVWWRRFI